MGKRTPDEQDLADRLVEATLDAAGEFTGWLEFTGSANLHITGNLAGTIVLDRSFDGGATAVPMTNLGLAVQFTGPASEMIFCREAGVLHRLRCTARTSGAAQARLSQ